MLLDLPPEILEHILLRLDASSFSVILMTCKAIRSNVLSSSKLIYSQLLRLPGLRVFPAHGPRDRERMLKVCIERAASHACNGLEVFCDSIVYTPLAETSQNFQDYYGGRVSPVSHLWTSPKRSLLQVTSGGLFSAAVDSNANIHIYKIHQGQIFPKGVLPSSLLEVDHPCLFGQETVRFSVAGLSFQKCHCSTAQPPHIIALYRYHIAPSSLGQSRRFIQDAIECSKKRMKLVVWKLCQGNLTVSTIRDVELKSPSWADQPVSIITSEFSSRRTKSPPVSMVFRCGSGRNVGYHMHTCYYDRDNGKTVDFILCLSISVNALTFTVQTHMRKWGPRSPKTVSLTLTFLSIFHSPNQSTKYEGEAGKSFCSIPRKLCRVIELLIAHPT